MQHVLEPNACFFRVLCPCLACSSSLFIFSLCSRALYFCQSLLAVLLCVTAAAAVVVAFFTSFPSSSFVSLAVSFCSIFNAYAKCARLLRIYASVCVCDHIEWCGFLNASLCCVDGFILSLQLHRFMDDNGAKI